MAITDLTRGQDVEIPAIKLTDGAPLRGRVRATDGQTIIVELIGGAPGDLPTNLPPEAALEWNDGGVARACLVQLRDHGLRAVVCRMVVDERRQAPRLRVDMQVSYGVVPPGQAAVAIEEVMAQVNQMREPDIESIQMMKMADDPFVQVRAELDALKEMLSELMVKVDDLTAIVKGQHPTTDSQMIAPLGIVNCSSTGLGMLVSDELTEGTTLRLRLKLRTAPPAVIDCVGEVRRVETVGGGEGARREVGVEFTHIHESDRERLIHYLFKIQRRMLRDLKEARDAVTGAA